MKRVTSKEIQALIPLYTDEGGNFTSVKAEEGETLLEKSVRTVLKNICEFYHYDLEASNKDYRRELGIKKLPPIPLKDSLVLIAVKVRKPIGKNDGAYAYVNVGKVEKVEGSKIIFKDGTTLETLSTEKTIKTSIYMARSLKEEIKSKKAMVREEEVGYTGKKIKLYEDLHIVIYKKY